MLLAYCITSSAPQVETQAASAETGSLRAYFRTGELPVEDPEELKRLALESYRVTQSIFEQTTAIPFRFPALLKDDTELREFLEANQTLYAEELRRLEGLAQVRISFPHVPKSEPRPASGTEFLQRRADALRSLQDKLNQARAILGDSAREFREESRGTTVLLFALVPRQQVEPALTSLRAAGMMEVSGPWPPSEFVTCYPQGANV